MRIQTPEGEEKDLYQVHATETDEEKWHMPSVMHCAACQAVAHQAATRVGAALDGRYATDLVGTVTLEALQDLCADSSVWVNEYGYMPTGSGYNTFNGTGITHPEGTVFPEDIMLTSQHGGKSGEKLANVCKALILGADAIEEDEFASMYLEASGVEDAVVRYRAALCEGPSQPCAKAEEA